jgi:hypothetical protein
VFWHWNNGNDLTCHWVCGWVTHCFAAADVLGEFLFWGDRTSGSFVQGMERMSGFWHGIGTPV